MKILVLHWGRNGGGPRFALDAVRGLQSAGAQVGFSYSTESDLDADDLVDIDELLPVTTFRSAKQSVTGVGRALEAASALGDYVQRHRIDGVFSAMEQVWQPAAARSIAATPVPYLLGMHDGVFHLGEFSRLRDTTRRLEVRSADGLLALSDPVRDAFLQHYPFPADRVWTSFLPSRSRSIPATPTPTPNAVVRFGFFGRILPYKGVELLIDACRLLADRRNEFEVEIWGEDRAGLLAGHDLPATSG